MQILHTAIPYREVQGLQGNLCNEDTDKNFVDNFLHVVIYLALGSKHLAWNMEENCLASELLHIKIILLVLSNAFFKSPKLIPTSSKIVLISDLWNIKS